MSPSPEEASLSSCRTVVALMKTSFEAYALSAPPANTDSRENTVTTAVWSKARAAINQTVPPASYLALVLAVVHMNTPRALLTHQLARFNPLQLALLTLSSPSAMATTATTNPFASLATSSSSSSSSTPVKASKKRLRFQEDGMSASACVSPPNDREPGTAQKFESYAKMLEGLLLACDVLAQDTTTAAEDPDIASSSSSSSSFLSTLLSSLAELSLSSTLVQSLLSKTLTLSPSGTEETQTMSEAATVADVSQMAHILCTELAVRRCALETETRLPGQPSQSQSQNQNQGPLCRANLLSLEHLAIPAPPMMHPEAYGTRNGCCQFRSVLRHRVSWVLTSIIR